MLEFTSDGTVFVGTDRTRDAGTVVVLAAIVVLVLAATIVKVTVVDADPAIDPVAVTVAVAVEGAVGVPLMTPVVESMTSPAGSSVAV